MNEKQFKIANEISNEVFNLIKKLSFSLKGLTYDEQALIASKSLILLNASACVSSTDPKKTLDIIIEETTHYVESVLNDELDCEIITEQ